MSKAKKYVASNVVTTPLRGPISEREKDAIQVFRDTGCIGALNSSGLMVRKGQVVRKEVLVK